MPIVNRRRSGLEIQVFLDGCKESPVSRTTCQKLDFQHDIASGKNIADGTPPNRIPAPRALNITGLASGLRMAQFLIKEEKR